MSAPGGAFARGWARYWHGFSLERDRLFVLRVAFFGMLAVDQWLLMLSHAPRYGQGDFNVSQIAWLDPYLPMPSPAIVGTMWLVGGFLALRAALGIAVKQSAIGVALCYGGVYLWSQADSYQHHYLLVWMAGLLALLPTGALALRGPDPDQPATLPDAPPTEDAAGPGRVQHWVLRALYVQIALLYWWTAVAKFDPVWLDGHTIEQLTRGPEIRAWLVGLEQRLGLSTGGIFPLMAVGVMLGEIFAAVVFLWRRLWVFGLLIVPWFHVLVEKLGFDIELFSYYMIALDVILLSPPRLIAAIADTMRSVGRPVGVVVERLRAAASALPARGPRFWGLAGLTAAIALAVGGSSPVEGATAQALLFGAMTFAAFTGWPSPRTHRPLGVAAGQVLALGAFAFALHGTETAYDYYRLWGGDLKRRNELEAAAVAYERANALRDGLPARRMQLGDIYLSLNRRDDALTSFRASLERHREQVTRDREATHRRPADAEAWFELGDNLMRVAERCGRLAAAARQDRDSAGAEEMARCTARANVDAVEAFDRGLSLEPMSTRGRRGKAQAQAQPGGRR